MSTTQPMPTPKRQALPYILVMGWLVKSPPENKMKRSCKLLRSSWRKRFFVLRQSEHISYNYEMIYFKNRESSKIIGAINLESCQQIIEAVTSHCFPNLLAVNTVHRGKTRTYYLAAPSQGEMKEWVHWLCIACGMNMTPLVAPCVHLDTSPGNLSNIDRQFLVEHPSTLQKSSARVFNRTNSATIEERAPENKVSKEELDTKHSASIHEEDLNIFM